MECLKIEDIKMYFCDGGKYIEIGPLDKPFLKRSECDVSYLDYSSTDMILKSYKDSYANIYDIVDIDYPTLGRSYFDTVEGTLFDAVYSAHCIEHTIDFIGHLCDVESILKTGGRYVLVVPDGDNYADFARQNSTFREVYNVFQKRQNLEMFKIDCVCNSTPYTMPKDVSDLFNKHTSFSRQLMYEDYDLLSKKLSENGDPNFWGGHVWKFSYKSILEILRDCIRFGLINFEIEACSRNSDENNYNLYFVLKKKSPECFEISDRRKAILEIQKEINLVDGIKDPILEHIELRDKIYIYGTGARGKRLLKGLKDICDNSIEFVISDSEKEKESRSILDTRVKLLSEVDFVEKFVIFVAVANYQARQEIEYELNARGLIFNEHYFIF